MLPEFIADAHDDCDGSLFAGPPMLTPADAAVGRMLVDAAYRRAVDCFSADPGFLSIVAPDLYLSFGSIAVAFVQGMQQQLDYIRQSAEYKARRRKTRNKVLHDCYTFGVLTHGSEFAVACGGGR